MGAYTKLNKKQHSFLIKTYFNIKKNPKFNLKIHLVKHFTLKYPNLKLNYGQLEKLCIRAPEVSKKIS